MGNFKDLTGIRYDRVTVVKKVDKPENRKQKGIYWLCLCDCGNYCVKFAGDIRENRPCSCGKCNTEDLTGRKFGKLTVVERADNYVSPKGKQQSVWKCLCDCQLCLPPEQQVYTYTKGFLLRTGQTKSCGCIQNHKNIYDLTGEYGIGYTSKGEPFYFDLEDYDKIKDYCWHINKEGYLYAGYNYENKQTTIRMHRIIMNLNNNQSDIEVDHIHGKKTRNDNRKSNLRLANRSQNGMNRGLSSNNTSGFSGVTFDSTKNKWIARIGYYNNSIRLGAFDTKEEAIKIRKEAEEKYFGEWSYDNSQKHDINEN